MRRTRLIIPVLLMVAFIASFAYAEEGVEITDAYTMDYKMELADVFEDFSNRKAVCLPRVCSARCITFCLERRKRQPMCYIKHHRLCFSRILTTRFGKLSVKIEDYRGETLLSKTAQKACSRYRLPLPRNAYDEQMRASLDTRLPNDALLVNERLA